jgi:hypothetical protein
MSINDQGIISVPHGSGNPFTAIIPLIGLLLVVMGAVTIFHFQKTLKETQQLRSQAAAERTAAVIDGCVITGCNSEVCTDKSTAVQMGATTCVVRPEYACLSKSVCRVQGNGKCGWAQTAGYTACLADLNSISTSPLTPPVTSPSPFPSPSSSPMPEFLSLPHRSNSPEASAPPKLGGNFRGDFNNDGKVDDSDYKILMKSFFRTGANQVSDLNQDNKVDLIDYVLFRRLVQTQIPAQQ